MNKYTTHIELAARIYVFILINVYGTGKIMGGQFYRKGNIPPEVAEQTLGTVGSYDLAWTFMGHSFAYILFIGLSQIIGGWCLLWNRTKLIGIAILIPILLNIIVFDLVFFDTYGALASAIIYLSLLILVLFLNKEQVLSILKEMTRKSQQPKTTFLQKLKPLAIVGFFLGIIFGFEQIMINLIGF